MAEGQVGDASTLPPVLAILPFWNKVLLPGAIVKIRVNAPASVRLIEQELWQKEDKGRLIGVLPLHDRLEQSSSAGSSVLSSSSPQGTRTNVHGEKERGAVNPSETQVSKNGDDLIQWHPRGVAARALELEQEVEKYTGRVTYTVMLEGWCRFGVQELISNSSYKSARITQLDRNKAETEQAEKDPEVHVLSRQFKAVAGELISLLEQKQKSFGRTKVILESWPAYRLADIFVANFEVSFEERLFMLDAVDLRQRLSKATEIVARHLQTIKVAEKLSAKVDGQLSKNQKEVLRHQIRAIKEELGDNDDDEDDVVALEKKMQTVGMPPNVWKHAQRELRRLRKMQPQQPGYGSSRTYLELLAELPWQVASEEREIDLVAAKERLDSEHYGLSKVKKRIIEYLAVRKLKPDARGPVLCFVGPPGVGKTSLASSIAGALGRKFIRLSLGGVRDEADIRGHRRTYIGSMPGRLIDGIKRVGVNNPVMLLDEIDKTGADVRGDPASALLEVLDPEQNKTFNDHYLNVPFDVSKVVFLATANRVQTMSAPLLDRMEVIELPGYTPEEKLHIAMRHLIPRVLDQHGITDQHVRIPESMVELMISRYTREAGVRNLERHIAALARAAAVKVAEKHQSERVARDMQPEASQAIEQGQGSAGLGDSGEVELVVEADGRGREVALQSVAMEPLLVDEAVLEQVLGPPRFDGKEAAERVATPGVAVGLVWTAVGGEVQFVEATTMIGKGNLHLTGQLGDVIKESAQIALTWVRARAAELKLPVAEAGSLMKERDVHIHFPAGAVPKDGPSAGVTLVTALVSLFGKRSVRADTAMTGEMTLRGLVLPVGGVKDKILAAHRCGLKRVILPDRNQKDLQEVPAAVLANMEILLAKRMEDVLHHAFEEGCPWQPASRL
ncbi:hypothetical protein M758_7G147500 [Ceratodon purpureus]|uniref:Lon protease homolog 2, peroxisomal n=1 Tax=Ceratodon purpureus TaxID=3225 RepID=A0A8T0HAH2_CERPU|nr:hypothetical protein KC19_7G130800 [Ceratodon purpureus]KAG0611538.1 hypothetical protein M758_7G147500 [Ceratodon purpureus]